VRRLEFSASLAQTQIIPLFQLIASATTHRPTIRGRTVNTREDTREGTEQRLEGRAIIHLHGGESGHHSFAWILSCACGPVTVMVRRERSRAAGSEIDQQGWRSIDL
jgi:hypothetical protein